MRMLNPLSIELSFILIILMLTPAYASQLGLNEGSTLFYKCARISSGISGYQTWDDSLKILTLNETALIFQSSSTSSKVTAKYQDGTPTYIDYLTALIYLPPECLAESLLGNLNWTTHINTHTLATVTEKTSQTLNFTVQAGTFQSLNLTLTLTGLDSGTLAFIYDVNSGILIYEQWSPIYGDIITLSLMTVTNAPGTQETILDLILPTAAIATPVATLVHQTRKAFQKRRRREQQPKNAAVKSGFSKKPFYAILAGAMLNLASVFLPWSQFSGSQIYLPLSLPSALTESSGQFTLTSTFAAISLTAHATAILAWASIAMHLYTTKKVTPELVTITSSILAFASAAIFIQTGWTSSWGLLIMVTGGILTIAGTAAANIKIEITTEEQKESEDTSTL